MDRRFRWCGELGERRGVVGCHRGRVSNHYACVRVFLSTLPTPGRNSHAVLWVALAVLPTYGKVREYSQV